MNRLSVEVLHSIFLQLHLLNKIECMLVCRKWANIIRDTTLLHTIHINDGHDFHRFFKMLLRNPSRGNQVKRLALNACFEETFDKMDLLELLPKLQFFEIYRYVDHRYTHENYFIRNPYDLKRLDSLRCEIEHIIDYECSEFTFLILTAGVCPRLTVLEVDLDYNYRSISPLADLLRNAPGLRKLKLANVDITISDLEKIHTNAPHLELFSIEFSSLEHSTLPVTLIPAKSITSLLLHFSTIDVEIHMIWFHYIRQKYPNLQQFKFKEHRLDLPEEKLRNRVISDGLAPLLKSFGSQLKSLELGSVYLEPDLFKKIDKCDSEIEQFTTFCVRPRPVIENIIQSSQCRFIQKLTLLYTSLFSIEIIKEMMRLTSLEIYFISFLPREGKPTINLHRLFEFCPKTLDTLRIDGAHLTCDATFNHSFSLKKFTFRGPKLSKRVERFLSFCLPNLRSLFLIDCVSNGSCIDFSSKNLAHLEIELEDPDYYPDLSVFTLDDNLHRFYPMEEKGQGFGFIEEALGYVDPSLYKGQQRISPNQLSRHGLITVECASLQKLVINGRLAC